jgi:hypothetical protein
MTWAESKALGTALGNPGGVTLTDGRAQTINTVLPVTLSFNP